MTNSTDAGLQSPIDLVAATPLDAPGMAADLLSGPFSITHTGTTLSVEPDRGGAVWVGPRRMALGEVHFHHPSEHTVAGSRSAAEIHLVHTDDDGRTCVLGVLLDEGPANAQLEMLLASAPAVAKTERPVARFDPRGLLPTERATWRYEGSLTTPPHTTGVSWFVLSTALTASADQLARLRAAFPANARPCQERAGRPLWRCE